MTSLRMYNKLHNMMLSKMERKKGGNINNQQGSNYQTFNAYD
jgi:hypothetical protein